ncbi:MAG: hypothetical protein WA005_05530 [Candidatus Binataceae bacterium]
MLAVVADQPNPTEIQALTEEQRAQVEKWMGTKWAHKNCPMCAQFRWFVGTFQVVPPALRNNALDLTGPAYFFVPVFCLNCGHTIFLNSRIIGIAVAKPKTDAE